MREFIGTGLFLAIFGKKQVCGDEFWKGTKKVACKRLRVFQIKESDYALGAVKLNEAVLMKIWRMLHNE